MDSLRISLASSMSSKTPFEVLGLGLKAQVFGLGLEAYKSSKMLCSWLKDNTIFWFVKKQNNETKINLNFYSLSIYFFSLFKKEYNVIAKKS